jgi:argininosuccinate lyase
MPQKRNPVALEHIRTLASKALGQSLGVITAVHNTPFGDINDVEDDLQPLIYNAVRDANRSVSLFVSTLQCATFNFDILRRRASEHFITVTELADTIVRKENLSFRIAHKIVGACVKTAVESGTEITFDSLQNVSEEILGRSLTLSAEEVKKALTTENFVAVRTIYGGPAPSETRRALAAEREHETYDLGWFDETTRKLKNAAENLESVVAEKLI